MSKPRPEHLPGTEPAAGPTPLTPGIRRHLGQNLRTLYADTLAAPPTQRLEALIAQLGKVKR